MANALLLSKFTATKHPPARLESRILHQIHRLSPSFNLGFTPSVDLSHSSLKTSFTHAAMKLKPPKSASVSVDDLQFHLPMLDHDADQPSPRICLQNKAAHAILNLKKWPIPLVIGLVVIMGVVLLMSYPPSAWAKKAAAIASVITRNRCNYPSSQERWTWLHTLLYGGALTLFLLKDLLIDLLLAVENWGITTVLKLQVGLSGSGGRPLLKRELELVAEFPSTSTHTVQSRVLTETTRALLCYPEACISAHSHVHVQRNIKGCKKMFDQLSTHEHARFNEKTLVNVNNVQRYHPTNLRDGGHNNDYKVVTILVLAEGDHKIPSIKGSTDLKIALQKLESIPPTQISDLKVLWTPQAENKTLSVKEASSSTSLAGSQGFV